MRGRAAARKHAGGAAFAAIPRGEGEVARASHCRGSTVAGRSHDDERPKRTDEKRILP